jgi:hypothetical protein
MGDCIKPSNWASKTSLGGMLANCFTPFTSRTFPLNAPATNHQLVVGFRELSHYFGSSHSIFGKAVDQRTGHLVRHNFKRATGDSTAGQGVLQHTQAHTIAASGVAQFGHVSNRDAAVLRDHERLSFSGEAGHITDDRFFLTAIQTQGLLLKLRSTADAISRATLQRPTVSRTHIPSAAGSPSALALSRQANHQALRLSVVSHAPTVLDDLQRPLAIAAHHIRQRSHAARIPATTPRWTGCRREHPHPWSTRPQLCANTHPCSKPAWLWSAHRSAQPGCLELVRIE